MKTEHGIIVSGITATIAVGILSLSLTPEKEFPYGEYVLTDGVETARMEFTDSTVTISARGLSRSFPVTGTKNAGDVSTVYFENPAGKPGACGHTRSDRHIECRLGGAVSLRLEPAE